MSYEGVALAEQQLTHSFLSPLSVDVRNRLASLAAKVDQQSLYKPDLLIVTVPEGPLLLGDEEVYKSNVSRLACRALLVISLLRTD